MVDRDFIAGEGVLSCSADASHAVVSYYLHKGDLLVWHIMSLSPYLRYTPFLSIIETHIIVFGKSVDMSLESRIFFSIYTFSLS